MLLRLAYLGFAKMPYFWLYVQLALARPLDSDITAVYSNSAWRGGCYCCVD